MWFHKGEHKNVQQWRAVIIWTVVKRKMGSLHTLLRLAKLKVCHGMTFLPKMLSVQKKKPIFSNTDLFLSGYQCRICWHITNSRFCKSSIRQFKHLEDFANTSIIALGVWRVLKLRIPAEIKLIKRYSRSETSFFLQPGFWSVGKTGQ